MKNISNKLFCLVAFLSVGLLSMNAQVKTYRLSQIVSPDGVVTEIEYNPNRAVQKVYLRFNNNKSSFYICTFNGSRAGHPDASSDYQSSYGNITFDGTSSGIGVAGNLCDKMDFVLKETKNGTHIFTATRPLYSIRYSGFERSLYVSGYATDYVKFNSDYSRLNVIVDPQKGMYGVYPFIYCRGYDARNIFVFEEMKKPQPDTDGDMF